MRILIVHNYYQFHGGEDVVFEQETQMLAASHEVATLSFHNKKGLKGFVQHLFYPWNIFASRRILKQVKQFKPDIVHIHNTHYAIGPLIFRRLRKRNIPVVQTLHNFRILDPSATLFHNGQVFTDTITKDFPWKSVWKKVLDNSLIKTFLTAATYYFHKKIGTWQQVNKFLVFSEFGKDLLLRSTLHLRPDQIAIKPNFVNPIAVPENPVRENYFVYIGRLSPEKGILPLLRAFSKSSCSLKIYGTGPLQSTVEKYAHRYPNIEFHGFQQKDVLYQALSRSQALVVPSIWFEGMPMTVLESFACGTPVLASKIGILSEMIQDGKNGTHFEAGHEDSLVAALDKWQNLSTEEKRQISVNCQNEYWGNYSPEKNVLLLESIYRETLKQVKK
ncbi:glycosyltransferase family 4 protein [Sphingobacterium sp. SGG-5]|uniref:glycosyltransferase family 4 protein n=1 Tax=Sphingobacterium sp. SGG-5 TaxID=2710881 RepID=UPI0013EBAE3B|nr:glycosyltransferase family 4 protein [Sphingobacterium sp. SGG-5]NGM60509.1 glycosyltransferase family 4 protein [Sphingobacterium sp. SGG-5]